MRSSQNPHDGEVGRLLARIREGDPSAFEELVKRYQQRVYGLALRLTANQQAAEDVLQKTFLAVYQKLSTFRGESGFFTWLYRIAMNTALMHQRGEIRTRAESLEDYLPKYNGDGRLERLDLDYGRVARADELLEREEFAQMTLDALGKLPEIYRSVFVMRDLEELSTEETAEVLEIDPQTVRMRLHRARLMLRGYLGHLLGGET